MGRKNVREMRAERGQILDKAKALVEKAERERRDFTPGEQRQYDDYLHQAEGLMQEVRYYETGPGSVPGRGATVIYNSSNDEATRALAHYVRSGDKSGLRDTNLFSDGEYDATVIMPRVEKRAVDEIMNVAATADGQAVVPTGFAGQIAARRSEIELASKLGCLPVPGQGTTVNFPYENADPSAFAQTAEQVDNLSNVYQRDRPTFGVKPFTLVKYTKKLVLTEELEQDEDANLMGFIADHIGRAIAMTNNILLLTEVAANGTALKTFNSATVIANDELEQIVYNDTLSYYLDDAGSVAWVMKPSVYGEIAVLDDANTRRYASFTQGPRSLLEYPVVFSNQASATQASAKSVYFGNWRYVGWRVDPALKLVRDQFSVDGVVILKYSFRCAFGVLVAGAIGYGVHPSA